MKMALRMWDNDGRNIKLGQAKFIDGLTKQRFCVIDGAQGGKKGSVFWLVG